MPLGNTGLQDSPSIAPKQVFPDGCYTILHGRDRTDSSGYLEDTNVLCSIHLKKDTYDYVWYRLLSIRRSIDQAYRLRPVVYHLYYD